jgi:SPP1 gp7 family putative phage head morphogenesis protein
LINPHPMAFDRISTQSAFIRSRKAETSYARQLRRLAAHIGSIIKDMWDPEDPLSASEIGMVLDRYAATIVPWASSVGRRMITEVAARDRQAWMKTSARMGRLLKDELDNAPTGLAMRQKLAEQVSLITSLPTEAAERVHRLTIEGITQAKRADVIAREIARSGEVTKSRATLIARTEVGRTATALTEARALSIGSTSYIWKTAGDGDVRPSHRAMAGQVVEWADPPELDGMVGHAGALPNCRCYASPIIPELY